MYTSDILIIHNNNNTYNYLLNPCFHNNNKFTKLTNFKLYNHNYNVVNSILLIIIITTRNVNDLLLRYIVIL
jgi:hypothetical protein